MVAGEPGVTGRAWMVVPHAAIPVTKFPTVTVAALQAPFVAISLITTAGGTTPVNVLLIRLFFTESEASPSGVTLQVQHEISCSSGANVYTLTQMLLPVAPVLVISTTESPMFRLAAYRTWNGESAVIGFWAKAAAANNRAVAEKSIRRWFVR